MVKYVYFLSLVAVACHPRAPAPPVDPHVACAAKNPDRNLYFGDLHIHSAYSFDANAFDVRTTPVDAYAFARGAEVRLPPFDSDGAGGRPLRLDRPLDFAAVTDHSEYLAEVQMCTTPGSPGYDGKTCTQYRGGGSTAIVPFGFRFSSEYPERFLDVCGEGNTACTTALGPVWASIQAAAEGAYDRSSECRFTSFIAYEYSGTPNLSTMHRNIIFRNTHVPEPVSYFEAPTPNELWTALRKQCLDGTGAQAGCDVLVIPHNPNESNGKMFAIEYPGATSTGDEKRQAKARAEIEPLVEIYQHKAASECLNGLSGVLGEPDEQCDFEKPRRDVVDCGDSVGQGGTTRQGCFSRMDFVRNVLAYGLREWQRLGANPFRLGIIASTDTHNGTPGAVDERDFSGHRGLDDDTPALRLGSGNLTPGGIEFSGGGLTAVWAEENTRDSIFEALRRREVYGTSGPRIAVRFFGGWAAASNACSDPNMVKHLYQSSVPMGATLAGKTASAPTFVLSALRDPGTASHPSVGLERAQIVKGWLDGGTPRVKVFDVAGGPSGATVDVATCTPSGGGEASLCGAWTDPEFDAKSPAYYYARIIEVPSCRWSTYECNALAPDARPASCSDPTVPKVVQERAWSSPIWYEPN